VLILLDQLSPDREPGQARLFPPLRVDAINVGQSGSLAEQLEQPSQRRPAAFGDNLDATVGPVPDPPGEAHLLGPSLDEVAEADSLDIAVHDGVEAGHRDEKAKAFQESRVLAFGCGLRSIQSWFAITSGG
jgi:hypothetical protein